MFKKITVAALLAVTAIAPAMAQERGIGSNISSSVPSVTHPEYGTNIIKVAPVTVMDVGVGFGLSYEKIFGKAQMIGLVVPVSLLLENKDDATAGYGDNARYNTYVYFTPGLKIYPFGQRKVTYAVGPNLMLGYGGGKEWQYREDMYGNMQFDQVKVTRFRLGLLVTNYVNFQVSKSFNLGLEGGLGMRYIDRISYNGSAYYPGNGDFNNGFDITGQFSLTLGYRF